MSKPEEMPGARKFVTEWALESWEPVKSNVAPTPTPAEILRLIQEGIERAKQRK